MGLESATFINGLVITNPDGSDGKSQGDDHLRLVKSVLKNTFPNITGAVTPTQAQLNVLAAPGTTFVPGMIIMWGGTAASIPAGWKLCNGVGTTSVGPVPDLRNRFIICSTTDSGGTYNIGNTGGSKDQIVVGSTLGHQLTVAQLPSHTHLSGGVPGVGQGSAGPNTVQQSAGQQLTSATGSNEPHSHNIAFQNTDGNLPPYYALAFIIKE